MRLYSVLDNLVLRAAAKRLPAPRSLKHFKFEAGERFWGEDDEVRYVLFPLDGVVSLRVSAGPSKEVETMVVGREGFAEIGSMLGAIRARASAVAITSGEALGMSLETFRAYLRHRAFRSAAEAYCRVGLVILEHISACNRVHGIDAIVAGRLLHMQDRTGRQAFEITQDALARQLGVRRASVSRAANYIQKQGAICYDRRGRLTIVDRGRLESLACTCYQAMKAELDGLVDARGGWQTYR
jgi:CRP-like cAMP-binding protein